MHNISKRNLKNDKMKHLQIIYVNRFHSEDSEIKPSQNLTRAADSLLGMCEWMKAMENVTKEKNELDYSQQRNLKKLKNIIDKGEQWFQHF